MKLLLSLFLAFANAESIQMTQFGGTNNSVDAAAVGLIETPDALNVELNRSATGVRKRDGFASFLTGYSTYTTTSLFAFKNQSGNECVLFTNGPHVFRSANNATAVALTTVTADARLYCGNSEGTAYCFTSSNDVPWSYDCTTRTDLKSLSYPNGKFNTFTQDRQLIAGTTDFPNRLFVSKSAAKTTFTPGNDAVDAWFEDIGTTGDRITFVTYLNGRVIVGKEYSIVGFNMTDQFNSVMYGISSDVGTIGPESLIQREGFLYLKGSDNEFYVLDGSPGGIKKISVEISSSTAGLLAGKVRYNIQTEKADWDAGTGLVNGARAAIRSDITVGSIEPSSVTLVDTSSADFQGGTVPSGLTITASTGSIQLSSAAFRIFDGDFADSSTYWTCTAAGGATCTTSGGRGRVLSSCGGASPTAVLRLLDAGTTVYTRTYSEDTGVLFGKTVDLVALGISTRALSATFQATGNANNAVLQSTTFTAISSFSFTGTGISDCGGSGLFGWDTLDNVMVNRYFSLYQSSITPLTFFSQSFDMTLSTPVGGTFTVSSSAVAGTGLAFQVKSATSPSGEWTPWANITNEDRITQQRRYYAYLSTFTTSVGTASPRIDSVSIVAATSGTYVTQCIEPGPGITAWGTVDAAGSLSAGASVQFQISVGADCSSLGAYVAQSTGTTIGAATSAALKFKIPFYVPSGTSTARIDSLTINWTEGTVASATYGAYWNNSLYWSVQNSTGGNNLLLKYDLINPSWWLFDVKAGPLLSFSNQLLFGSALPLGKVYRFSNINPRLVPTSDDGAAINAYWKSKNFTGSDSFVENGWEAVNTILKKQDGGSATITWQSNGGDSGTGSYSVGLSTGTNAVRSNHRVPTGTTGTFFSVKVGNNSTIPFELLGLRIDFTRKGYRPLP